MKRFVVALLLLFFAFQAVTIALAFRAGDGLVENPYFRAATDWFADAERAAAAGLSVAVPVRLRTGGDRLALEIATAAGPLRGAGVATAALRIGGDAADVSTRLVEEAPGRYAADVALPVSGRWLMRASIDGPGIRITKRWDLTADPAPAGGERHPPGDIHAGRVKLRAGDRDVVLEIAPRPVRAMTDLLFTVEIPGYAGAEAPYVDLEMPGMRMPPNRVPLVRGPDGRHTGRGVIVGCPSGGKRRAAAVTVPGAGTAVLVFDVAD